MRRIALVIADLSGGGAQRVITILAKEWATRGREVTLITFAGEDVDFFETPPSVNRIAIGGSENSGNFLAAIVSNFRRIQRLRRAIKTCNAQTVISFVGATNVLAVLACIGLSQKLVISERNDPARQSLGRIWDYLRRSLYGRADLVTANSEGAISTLATFVPEKRLQLVKNPILPPPDEFSASPEKIVLNIGRLTHQKAQDILIEAFASIASDFPGWNLVIAGEGNRRNSLLELTEELGVRDRVTLPGQIDTWEYLSKASIFALPSRFEGTPNAMLEAMSVGLPVIVTDASTGPLEYVKNEKSGLVIPPDDSDALSKALVRLMSDENKRNSIGREAQRSISSCECDMVMEIWDTLLDQTQN
jgi:GalNAc-alpha-(1->4)-GalNAc-alpha-(1->3)-diNAcBac-PP-undecaprenol alpha-1,4-N-acetyl-D-galactosaminyltransferase